MKFMMAAVQIVMVVMLCLYHEPGVIAAASILEDIQKEPRITIMLESMYLDGEVSEEIFTEKVANLEQLLRQYKEWQLVSRDDTHIVLQKKIDDISPLLKTSGYFGVSTEGILQIFNGVPKSGNSIHSFFQIDMKKLKSYERQQLKQGIRVKSKERFVKTIEEMKQYAVRYK